MVRGERALVVAVVALVLVFAVASDASSKWQRRGRAEEKRTLLVTLALQQRNLHLLEKHFWQVSTPSSPEYGRHWSKEKVSALVAPSDAVYKKAVAWLRRHQVPASAIQRAGNDDFIDVRTTVAQAEEMFEVQLFEYTHRAHETLVRTYNNTPVAVPNELAGVVQLISGLSGLPPVRERRVRGHRTTVDASSNDNAPVIQVIFAGPTALYPVFQVLCMDGSPATDASAPCTDHPPAVQSFALFLDGVQVAALTPTQAKCALSAGAVECSPKLGGLDSYRKYNFTARTIYVNNVSSAADDFFGVSILTSDFMTPQFVAQQYRVPQNLNGGVHNNSQAVAAFGGQYFSPADVQAFYQGFGIPAQNVTVIGPNRADEPGTEAELDVQWIQALGQGIPTTFWSIARGGYLLEWAKDVNAAEFPPLVHSISYESNEADVRRTYGEEWMNRVDVEFQKLGLRGVSVITGSGDGGASNVGHGSEVCAPFQPQYPATSPYITTASATVFTPSAQSFCYQSILGSSAECRQPLLEVAISTDNGMYWSTGGGFSNRSALQGYQTDAVHQYLQTAPLPPSANLWNPNGRAYPDVSMVGHNGVVYQQLQPILVDGTSMSSPTFAGLIAQLNGIRLQNNRSPLGFLNPFLYQAKAVNSAAFFDITIGDNRCCDVLSPPHTVCCQFGFSATQGWDAVTGLGSPNFAVLSQLVLTL